MTRHLPEMPLPSSEQARRRMETIRQRNTAPEMALRTELHRLGLRYRVNAMPIQGMRRRADVIFPKARVAVYVHGCFWHGCPLHATWPKANAAFWREKIEENRRRDADTSRRLIEAHWQPVEVWEHEDPREAAEKIAALIRSRNTRRAAEPQVNLSRS